MRNTIVCLVLFSLCVRGEWYFFDSLGSFLQKRNSKMRRSLEAKRVTFAKIAEKDFCAKLRLLASVHRLVQLYPSAVENLLKDMARVALEIERVHGNNTCSQFKTIHLEHFLNIYPRFTGRVESNLYLALGYQYDVYFLRLFGLLVAMDISDRKDWNAVLRYIANPLNSGRRLHLGIFGPYVAELNSDWTPRTLQQLQFSTLTLYIVSALHCSSPAKAATSPACHRVLMLADKHAQGFEITAGLSQPHNLQVSAGFVELLSL